MAGSSSKSPVTTYSGETYLDWSKKMKEHLISEGLWLCVEEGCKKPNQTEGMSATEMEELKKEMVNDAKALRLIHESLPPTIFMKVFNATTAKEAWETLHSMFEAYTKMEEKADELEDESTAEFVKSSVPSDEDGVIPLSGNKPYFDMVLMKSALKPLCHMNFPNRVNSMLPSINMVAKVRFFGKIYEIYFYGKRKQKSFGAGWRQLLDEHDMMAGDFLVFEIMESSDTKLEMNMQILRPTIPPEMEEEMRKRGIKPKPAINIDDDDEDSDDKL